MSYESSKHAGVCWHSQRQKWRAQPTLSGKQRHLGYFAEEAEAAQAVAAARAADEAGRLEEHISGISWVFPPVGFPPPLFCSFLRLRY